MCDANLGIREPLFASLVLVYSFLNLTAIPPGISAANGNSVAICKFAIQIAFQGGEGVLHIATLTVNRDDRSPQQLLRMVC